MFAQLNAPSSFELGGWLGCLGAILFIYNQFLKVRDHGKTTEINATVEGKTQFATKEEMLAMEQELAARVDKLENSLAKISTEIHGINTDLTKSGEERARLLHERINPAVENTAAIRGQMEAFTQSFNNFTNIIVSITQKKS